MKWKVSMHKIRGLNNISFPNFLQEEIIKAIDEVCNLLPGSLQLECNEFVTAFGPALIAILTTEIDPNKICTTLGLCPKIGRFD